jgi:hypothetical protein
MSMTSSAPWSARFGHKMASVSFANNGGLTSIVLVGGEDGNTYFNDVWESTNGGSNWASLGNGPFSARSGFAVAVWPSAGTVAGVNPRMWVLGGYDGNQYYDDAYFLSPLTGKTAWLVAEGGSTPWPKRSGMEVVVSSTNLLLLFGGGDNAPANVGNSSGQAIAGATLAYNDVWQAADSLNCFQNGRKCSIHGNCVAGVCNCYAGYMSVANGLCDTPVVGPSPMGPAPAPAAMSPSPGDDPNNSGGDNGKTEGSDSAGVSIAIGVLAVLAVAGGGYLYYIKFSSMSSSGMSKLDEDDVQGMEMGKSMSDADAAH